MTLAQSFTLLTQYRKTMVAASERYEATQCSRDYNSYNTARLLYLYLKNRFDELLEEWHEDTQELVVI